jgi:hypothetical protein
MRKLGLCAACAFAIAACGGSSTSATPDATPEFDAAPPDATPVVTFDDLCGPEGAYQKLIAKLISCNPIIDIVEFQGQATPSALTAFCHGIYDPYTSTIDLASYAELQSCLSYISSTSCLDLSFNAPQCDLFHGTVSDASGCDQSEQCSDASYCKRPVSTTCGTCTAKAMDGQPCSADEQCANGKCVGTQCGHPGVDGDPCVIDATTNSSDDCLGQRVCDPKTNKCVTRTWQLNDTCTGLGDCGILNTGMWCKPTDGVLGHAGQCANFLTLGTTCTAGNPGTGLCDLRSYQWCDQGTTGPAKCTAPNIVQDGHTCGLFQGNQCATGLVCSNVLGGNTNPGHCYAPVQKDGACGGANPPCALFMGCADGTMCEYTDDTPACP